MVKVIIYTKESCPFCIRAKILLKKYNVKFEEIIVNSQEEKEKLVEKTMWMTFPQIFINEQFVGGCDDLYKLESEGKLKTMLS